jgi:hypothetical protein
MRTPSRASISARLRAIVQFGLSATGSSSNGVTTRNAVSLFTGAGPGATLAFNASTPPRLKSLRQKRTVSSRTPNAWAIRMLVHPASVRSTARARSASPTRGWRSDGACVGRRAEPTVSRSSAPLSLTGDSTLIEHKLVA